LAERYTTEKEEKQLDTLECLRSQQMGKLKKGPPKGREDVYKENSVFLREKTIRQGKNRNYVGCYSLEFRRTTSGIMPLGSP
jgi:hypothetical protein